MSEYVEERTKIDIENLRRDDEEMQRRVNEALDSGEPLPGWMPAIPGPTHNNPILTQIQERYKRR